MKKYIAILFCSMMLAALAACSAGSDSTITSPRMGKAVCTIDDDCEE